VSHRFKEVVTNVSTPRGLLARRLVGKVSIRAKSVLILEQSFNVITPLSGKRGSLCKVETGSAFAGTLDPVAKYRPANGNRICDFANTNWSKDWKR
jgi:hypothetical protein